ncbi:hypothetical protein GCM10020256_35000 [Streptomyces thermocoprophilus]
MPGAVRGAGAGVLFALTALPVADVVLVAVSRRRAGRPLLRGGPDHLAHRLRRLGLTAQAVTVLLGAAAFATVAAGVMVHTGRAGQGGRAVGGRRDGGGGLSAAARQSVWPAQSVESDTSDGVCAGQSVVACKERIRVESRRLRSVDPGRGLMHT